jgi:polysaccharide biosynthesis transport protein
MAVISRRWHVVGVAVVCALIAALLGLSSAGHHYEATTTLQAPTSAAISASVRSDDVAYTDRLMNTYRRLAQSRPVRLAVARSVGRTKPVDLTITVEPNTELMKLTASAATAELAATEANAAARVLIAEAKSLGSAATAAGQKRLNDLVATRGGELAALRRQLSTNLTPAKHAELLASLRVKELDYQALVGQAAQLNVGTALRSNPLAVVEPAREPTSATGPRKGVILALALLFGLFGGAGVALLLERRSPQLYTLPEIEDAVGANVLVTVPRAARGRPAAVFNGGSPHQEAFGQLRAQLLSREPQKKATTVLITSALQGEGKSLVSTNLAAAIARSERTVLLVDTDMRAPTAHKLLGMRNGVGLSDLLLKDDVDIDSAIQHTKVPGLDLLPSGPTLDNPAEALATSRLATLFEALRTRYDFVIIDATAVLAVSDAVGVAAEADTVLLVVGRMPVRDRDLAAAVQRLEGVGAQPLGIVVNRWDDPVALAGYRRS